MGNATNWRLYCCLCGKELPHQRVMEQEPQGGNLRYIEREVGLVCGSCLDALPNARAPEAREEQTPRRGGHHTPGGYVAEPDPEDRREPIRYTTGKVPWNARGPM